MNTRRTLLVVATLCLIPLLSGADDQRRVFIAGDSTASSYPASRAPQAGWGQVLGYYLEDDVDLVNRAVSGRSTKSYVDEGKWAALLSELRPGDVVLISFGHNDSRDDAPARYAAPESAYRTNLVRFAEDVFDKGGKPVIVSSAARRLWEGPAMVETHGRYALNAGLAAAQSGADFVDLSNRSLAYFERVGREETKQDFLWLSPENSNARFPDGVEDNTHFTALGACGVALVIARALSEIDETAMLVRHSAMLDTGNSKDQSRPATVLNCAAQATWLTEQG